MEWHPTKNENLTPDEVTKNSSKRVWWLCKMGHEWQAIIYSRNKGSGCPYCKGKRAHKGNYLKTINPKLASQWHPTKNGDLTPSDVTASSNKKVRWLCGKGHEWQASISNRNQGKGCYICYKIKRNII